MKKLREEKYRKIQGDSRIVKIHFFPKKFNNLNLII